MLKIVYHKLQARTIRKCNKVINRITIFTLKLNAMKLKAEINIKEFALRAFVVVFVLFVFYIALVPNK